MLNTPVHELLREFTSIVWKCGPDSAEAKAFLLRWQHIEEFPSLARRACLMKGALDSQQTDGDGETISSFPIPRAA